MVKKVYLYDDDCGLDLKKIKTFAERMFKFPAVIKRAKGAVVTKGLLLDLVKTQDNIPVRKDTRAVIVTKRLFATLGDIDKRLHLRSCVFSYPSIISLSGIVEAPAKPREYYLARRSLESTGLWAIEEPKIKRRLRGRFIDHGDKRIQGVVKGLVAQAMFFYITGEPFCRHKGCRLYNAHWQEDLIYSQIKSGKFCARHSKILNSL